MQTEGDGLGRPLIGAKRPAEVFPSVHSVAGGRGQLAEQVILTIPLDPFLSLKGLTTYSSLSARKLRDHLQDPAYPLPHYRIGSKILVRRSDFDTWMARYRRVGTPELDKVVAEALRDIHSAPKR
jgi:hypothetical protein